MTITILTKYLLKSLWILYPVRVFRDKLKACGADIRICYGSAADTHNADVTIVTSDYFRGWPKNDSGSVIDCLTRLKSKTGTLIYYDMSDSTWLSHFGTDIIPIVDKYIKNQLFVDRSFYTRQFYGGEYFTDYNYRFLGVCDERELSRPPVDSALLGKMLLGWNFGLGDFFSTFRSYGKIGSLYKMLHPFPNYRIEFTRTNCLRNIDVSYRASTDYHRSTASYQRIATRDLLKKLASESGYRIIFEGKLPSSKFRKEMDDTFIVPSPFGWGEICYRDFECFIHGCTLVKPDMSHLVTWPDYYVPEITYVPHKWDFSDFEERICQLLNQPERAHSIAEAGQQKYIQSVSSVGGDLFAEHFMGIINSTPTYK